MEKNELVVISEQSLQALGAVNPSIVVDQVRMIQVIMRDVMREGEHYGKLPNASKDCLYKAGAEKLCFTFQLAPEFVVTERMFDGGHREYSVVCHLADRSGRRVATGVGSCSTMESKYRYRNGSMKCPKCGAEAIIKGKEEYGGGWICFAKKGGCGAKFVETDPKITSQSVGKVDNPDLADVWNTILKMAKKRAHVDATITGTACSDIFTQDLEDLPQFSTDASASAGHSEPQTTAPGKASPAKAAPAKVAATPNQRSATPAQVQEGEFTPASERQSFDPAGQDSGESSAATLPEGVPSTAPTTFKDLVALSRVLKNHMPADEHDALRADLNACANDAARVKVMQKAIDGLKGGF